MQVAAPFDVSLVWDVPTLSLDTIKPPSASAREEPAAPIMQMNTESERV